MDIVHVIDIKATPERVYQAITNQRDLAGWWVPKTKAEAKVGALFIDRAPPWRRRDG